MRIPQVAFATIDRRLSRRNDIPTFARVIPPVDDFGNAVVLYLQRDIWQRDYIGIVYDPDSEQFEFPLARPGDRYDYESISGQVAEGIDQSIYDSLGDIVENGYHTIILVIKREAFLDDVARIADELGLIGDDFVWILSGTALPPAQLPTLRYQVDSPIDRLLRGAAVFTNCDRFVYNGGTEPFLQAWRSQNETMVNRLNSLQPSQQVQATQPGPRQGNGGGNFYTAEPSYFQTETPTEYSSFIYDAVMVTGIGACNAQASSAIDPSAFVGHSVAILGASFQGASGPVSFKKDAMNKTTNARDPSGVLFGMHNARPGAVDEDGLQR